MKLHFDNDWLRRRIAADEAAGIEEPSGLLACSPEIYAELINAAKPQEKTMSVRAKMTLEGVYAQSWGGAKAIFRCVYDPNKEEDKSFQKATPTGMAEFQIDNPAAAEQLTIGKAYYFDISPAD